MRPGRKPQFIPKRQGDGNFKVYVPGRGVVNLETTDEAEAHRKAHEFATAHQSSKVTVSTQTQPNVGAPDPRGMIESWRQSSTMFAPSATQLPLPSQPLPSVIPSPSPLSLAPVGQQSMLPTTEQKVDGILPQDKRRKMADLISKVVTRVNVVACAAAVKMLGRIPAMEEDEEAENLLKEGWALQLEETFVNHPPAPWMVILAGSAAIGIGMYTDGTPIPKKEIAPPQSVTVDESNQDAGNSSS